MEDNVGSSLGRIGGKEVWGGSLGKVRVSSVKKAGRKRGRKSPNWDGKTKINGRKDNHYKR